MDSLLLNQKNIKIRILNMKLLKIPNLILYGIIKVIIIIIIIIYYIYIYILNNC